jgi:HAD superfamily hydrolase (TIGR01509 family)
MGGDKYVAAVAGDDVEQRLGDELRRSWEHHFNELLPEIQPCDGARELIVQLRARGHRVVVATSAIQSHFDTFIDDKLSARALADDWTTTDDVANSKPAPDLVTAALAKAGTSAAVMVGDTPWDCQAAERAGIQTICLLTGGFSQAELRAAGAAAVYESPRSLAERLDETALA